jgi:inner membrane protein
MKTWMGFFTLGIFGVFCHLGADFCNDYGVHPFSPFLNHWFYGDTLFIVEPLIWFSILPLAFLETKSLPLKGFVFALSAAIFGVLFFGPFVPLGIAFFVAAWAAVVFFWQRKVSQSRWNWAPSILMTLLVVLIFAIASTRLHEVMAQVMSENAPQEKIVQLVRTPSPADPFCWKTLVVSEGPEDRYAVREAVVSLWPGLVHATSCARKLEPSHTLKLAPVSFHTPAISFPEGVEIHWKGEYVTARSEMNQLNSLYCPFRALREFARVPFWRSQDGGWFAGDVRYDRSGGGGFSGVHFGFAAGDTPCPDFLPGWDPPVPN